MISAKPRSARRKKKAPMNKASRDTMIVSERILPSRAPRPSTAQRNKQARKVNFGNEMGATNQAVAGALQRLREICPDSQTAEDKQQVRRAIARKFCHAPKNYRENYCRDERL